MFKDTRWHMPSLFQLQPVQLSFLRSLRRNTHWKCLILTLLVCGCLAAIVWCRVTVVKVCNDQSHWLVNGRVCNNSVPLRPYKHSVNFQLSTYNVSKWCLNTWLRIVCNFIERLQIIKTRGVPSSIRRVTTVEIYVCGNHTATPYYSY